MIDHVRNLLLPWGFSLLFPLPLMVVDPGAVNSDIVTLYVGLSLAWLATEVFRKSETARTRDQWRSRIAAFLGMAFLNALLFVAVGTFSPTNSNIPWPLLICFAATTAIGLVPWLVLKLEQPQGAIVIAALVVGSIKLLGCIIARITYGPDFLQLGYASADWHTAKLMISCTWIGTLMVSSAAGLAWYHQCTQTGQSADGPSNTGSTG